MSLVSHWFKQLKRDWTIPEIHPERCVHSHCEIASCTRCSDVCPRQAWLLTDSSLAIDTSRCDGCGLCVASCPEQALTQTLELLTGHLQETKTLLLACEYLEEGAAGHGLVPCLHLLSSAQLYEYYQLGWQHIVSACADCAHCPRQQSITNFDLNLEKLNQLLASRACSPLIHQRVDSKTWFEQRKQLKRRPREDSISSRRQFLRQAVNFAVETSLEANRASSEDLEHAPQPWPTHLPNPADASQALYPFSPTIDALCCNGCDACLQLCPHQALHIQTQAKTLSYHFDASRCTGCKICMDSCDQQAVTVTEIAPQTESLLLRHTQCKACGSPFHYPATQSKKDYCRICSKTNHHRQLFQVY